MNREALLQLARVVQDAPNKGWNMSAIEMETSCGTQRCAFGWALIDPWFQANHPLAPFYERFKGNNGFAKVLGEAFDISEEDANNLFGGDLACSTRKNPVSKLAVLANIKWLLEGRPTKEY